MFLGPPSLLARSGDVREIDHEDTGPAIGVVRAEFGHPPIVRPDPRPNGGWVLNRTENEAELREDDRRQHSVQFHVLEPPFWKLLPRDRHEFVVIPFGDTDAFEHLVPSDLTGPDQFRFKW